MMMCTDFHSHVLPAVDDGSKSVEESLEMLRMEAQQNVRRLVATPHFYPNHDTPERFLKRRDAAWEKLRAAAAGQQELPEITLGAEVYYFAGMSDSDVLRELTVGGSDYLLLEMPHSAWTESMYREIEAIYVKRGITPIIAHVDRYLAPFRTESVLRQLDALPVLIQANSEFFQGAGARVALKMLREDRIHLLGSDCHNTTTRKPDLEAAVKLIEKRLGADALERICRYEADVLSAVAR